MKVTFAIFVLCAVLALASSYKRDKFNKYEVVVKMGEQPFKPIPEIEMNLDYYDHFKGRFKSEESLSIVAKNVKATKEYRAILETDINLENIDNLKFTFTRGWDLIRNFRGTPAIHLESVSLILDPSSYVNVYAAENPKKMVKEYDYVTLNLLPDQW